MDALDQSSLVTEPEFEFSQVFFLLFNQLSESVDFIIEDFDLKLYISYFVFRVGTGARVHFQVVVSLLERLVFLAEFLNDAVHLFELAGQFGQSEYNY